MMIPKAARCPFCNGVPVLRQQYAPLEYDDGIPEPGYIDAYSFEVFAECNDCGAQTKHIRASEEPAAHDWTTAECYMAINLWNLRHTGQAETEAAADK